jgi:hypothetical protein
MSFELPQFILGSHAMPARPEAKARGFRSIAEEYPVFFFHPFPRSTGQRAINFQPLVTGKPDISFLDEVNQGLLRN